MQPPQAPRFFGGMAPTAARRARPVQRGNDQGLPGDRRGPPEARQRLSRQQKGTGRGCTPGSCPVCTAFRRREPPYWGGAGGTFPRPLLSPHFFGKKWGPRPGRPRPARGYPGARTGNPSSAPVCALGHLPPTGGKASGGEYPSPGDTPADSGPARYPPLRQAGEPSCRGRRPERSRTARRGRRAPRAGDSGGGGILSAPTGRGSYPPAWQAPPYPSSSRSTCPAERAKSRAAARASWRVLPWVPTSTSTEPVDSCWLYREERMVMGRARVG